MIVILGVGCKGWGHTKVATQQVYLLQACKTVLRLDAITCFAAGEESIVAHNRSITPGKHKTGKISLLTCTV